MRKRIGLSRATYSIVIASIHTNASAPPPDRTHPAPALLGSSADPFQNTLAAATRQTATAPSHSPDGRILHNSKIHRSPVSQDAPVPSASALAIAAPAAVARQATTGQALGPDVKLPHAIAIQSSAPSQQTPPPPASGPMTPSPAPGDPAPATPAPSSLPAMAPTARVVAAQTQPEQLPAGSAAAHAGQAGAAVPAAPADHDSSPTSAPDDAASDTAGAVAPTPGPDPEATLQAAILAAQGGDTSMGSHNMISLGAITSTGEQSPPLITVPAPAARAVPAGKALSSPQLQTSPAASFVPPSADRQHKTTSVENATPDADASSTAAGKSQVQTTKPQIADAGPPQSALANAHTTAVAAASIAAAPASIHAGSLIPSLPAQSTPTPAALLAMLQQPDLPATPLVSSARLIQSIQQSDMRVGLNSEEFGAISIHTTTERGVLSSEITLGHEELARTLSVHLAGMQELPGIPQSFSVRLNTTSATGEALTGSSEQSSEGRHQNEAGRTASSRTASSQPWAQQAVPTAARNTTSHGVLAGRLDIRI